MARELPPTSVNCMPRKTASAPKLETSNFALSLSVSTASSNATLSFFGWSPGASAGITMVSVGSAGREAGGRAVETPICLC